HIENFITDKIEVSVKTHNEIGRIYMNCHCVEAYIDILINNCSTDLSELNILLDCANGAASAIAPEVFRRAGCNVSHIHSSPDGLNINKDCGSTHINSLAEHVKKGGFDVGFAYDG
ncbi:MAG TPA: phosphoglucosamine mutase, partial [Clostridia bacterium]|nr:phosphoglucosamine mutase [Clostridia bacterium]